MVRPGSHTRVADGWVPKLAPGANPGPLMQSIVLNYTDGALDPAGSRGMFVTLSDAQHCYFLTGKNFIFSLYGQYKLFEPYLNRIPFTDSSSDLQGVLVSAIPFTHPTQVPDILAILRQQVWPLAQYSCVCSIISAPPNDTTKF